MGTDVSEVAIKAYRISNTKAVFLLYLIQWKTRKSNYCSAKFNAKKAKMIPSEILSHWQTLFRWTSTHITKWRELHQVRPTQLWRRKCHVLHEKWFDFWYLILSCVWKDDKEGKDDSNCFSACDSAVIVTSNCHKSWYLEMTSVEEKITDLIKSNWIFLHLLRGFVLSSITIKLKTI